MESGAHNGHGAILVHQHCAWPTGAFSQAFEKQTNPVSWHRTCSIGVTQQTTLIYTEQHHESTITRNPPVSVERALASADFSANLGFASDYYFRGIFQTNSSANGGVDFESGGFYAGVWAADVGGDIAGDGLEVDGYFGYGFDVGEVSLGIGFTGYYYTGDFDDTYQEINLSAGYGWLTVDAAIGKYDAADGPSLDYQFYSATRGAQRLSGASTAPSRTVSRAITCSSVTTSRSSSSTLASACCSPTITRSAKKSRR